MDLTQFPSPHTHTLARTLTIPLTNPTMSLPDPSPTTLTPDTPLFPTQLSPDTPSSSTFPAIPVRNPSRNNGNGVSHRPSQTEVTLEEALRQGPVTIPKNPRHLSELEANLSRRERRKSKAWAGGSYGIGEDLSDEEGGRRKSSGPLDAEEMKELLLRKLRRLSKLWSNRS